MPAFVPGLDGIQNTDPNLYEVLTAMNQQIPSPGAVSLKAQPIQQGTVAPATNVAAPPGVLYFQLDSSGALVARWLKTTGTDANGWVAA